MDNTPAFGPAIIITVIIVGMMIVSYTMGKSVGKESCNTCDIGYNDISGDYFPRTNECAVKDCIQFNIHNELNNHTTRCSINGDIIWS